MKNKIKFFSDWILSIFVIGIDIKTTTITFKWPIFSKKFHFVIIVISILLSIVSTIKVSSSVVGMIGYQLEMCSKYKLVRRLYIFSPLSIIFTLFAGFYGNKHLGINSFKLIAAIIFMELVIALLIYKFEKRRRFIC